MSGRREEIMVQNLRSSSAVRVQLYLNGMGIEATVATAADVTIVAEHFLKKIGNFPCNNQQGGDVHSRERTDATG